MSGCFESVEAFLEAHPDVSGTPEAAAALAAGREIDNPRNSATSKSMMVGRFLDSMALLRAMSPDQLEVSPLDEIKSRRDAKLRRSDAKNRGGSAGKAAS